MPLISSQREVPNLKPSAMNTVAYFVYYNQLLTFLLIVLLPSLTLALLNTLIFRRLQVFKRVSVRLGREERKTVRATASLIAIVVFFLICHSLKVFINGYQVVEVRMMNSVGSSLLIASLRGSRTINE